jgi:hypothetical protein
MRFKSLLTIGGLCLLWLGLLWIPTPDAIAAHCRTVEGKQVCIAWIKRSAKRYWEYQAALAIEGKRQPKAVYDCRSRAIIDEYDTAIPFRFNDPAAVVCDLYRERSKSMRLSDLSAPKKLSIKP